MKDVLRVTGKSRYSFIPDGETQLRQGAKIFLKDNQIIRLENKEGIFDTEFKMPYHLYDEFPTIPGVYEVEFAMKVGSEGQFTVKGAEYVGEYELENS